LLHNNDHIPQTASENSFRGMHLTQVAQFVVAWS
jgi:hypothetical protein